MYKTTELKKKVLESGVIFNPRIHKQFLPYQVLTRYGGVKPWGSGALLMLYTRLYPNLQWLSIRNSYAYATDASKVALAAVRALRDAKVFRNSKPDVADMLTEIWGEAWKRLALQMAEDDCTDIKVVLKGLGINYLKDSLYDRKKWKPLCRAAEVLAGDNVLQEAYARSGIYYTLEHLKGFGKVRYKLTPQQTAFLWDTDPLAEDAEKRMREIASWLTYNPEETARGEEEVTHVFDNL